VLIDQTRTCGKYLHPEISVLVRCLMAKQEEAPIANVKRMDKWLKGRFTHGVREFLPAKKPHTQFNSLIMTSLN
jgi:hypothetical protein